MLLANRISRFWVFVSEVMRVDSVQTPQAQDVMLQLLVSDDMSL